MSGLLPLCSRIAVSCVALLGAAAARADVDCASAADLKLINGRIYTLDAHNTIATSVSIKNGRFVSVGTGSADDRDSACTKVVDLGGHVVIPGLIDNHNHFVLFGLRPGHHVPLENASSIAEVLATLAAKAASVPAGEFITTIGGFNPAQFAEHRFPTLAELDGAIPTHPVYIQESFTGPAVTNTPGKAFFQSKGISVDANGNIAPGAPSVAALNALRALQTFDDKKRGTLEAMAYSARFGLTTNVDMGGFIIPGTPNTDGEFAADGAASWDPYTAYDPLLALHREHKMLVRLRVFFLSMDTTPDIPILTNRVLNAFRQFGDDWMRISGLGEFITSWALFGLPNPSDDTYNHAINVAATKGWIYQQHTLSTAEDTFAIDHWEALNQTTPIAPLHWSLAHVITITQQNIDRLKSMGAGVAVHGWLYLFGAPGFAGPPYRRILDSGIRAGAGSDSAQISTLNPWLMMYYMVTGKNCQGQLINAGQTTTREEALRLYTAANGWFFKEQDNLGSIEVGKLGDLAVLNADFLNSNEVPDEAIKKISALMTVVGGRIVHDTGTLAVSKPRH